jgi:hypothetical protein
MTPLLTYAACRLSRLLTAAELAAGTEGGPRPVTQLRTLLALS